jgi:uncharacterized protein
MKYIIFIILLTCSSLLGQNPNNTSQNKVYFEDPTDPNYIDYHDTISANIIGIVDPERNIAMLRWGVSNYGSLMAIRDYGFRIVRRTVKYKGVILNKEDKEASIVSLGLFKVNLQEDCDYCSKLKTLYEVPSNVTEPFSDTDLPRILDKKKEKDSKAGIANMLLSFDYNAAIQLSFGVENEINLLGEYEYTISPNRPIGGENSDYLLSTSTIVSANNTLNSYHLNAPVLTNINPGDKEVLISWKMDSLKTIAFFNIEMDQEGGNFEKINTVPIIPIVSPADRSLFTYKIASLKNEEVHNFQLYGVDMFGRQSPISNKMNGGGKTPPIPATPNVIGITPTFTDLTIEWQFDIKYIAKVAKFKLVASSTIDGLYTQVAENIGMNYSYTIVNPPPVMYYKVIAVDDHGYERESYATLGQLRDNTPPAQPGMPICTKINNEGALSIQWKPNTDSDLMGYRLFAADNLDGDYIQFTPTWIRDTSYNYAIDVNTLTRYAFFKVAAIDFRENLSLLSEACRFKIPDIIPPASPLLLGLVSDTVGIQIKWIKSPSNDVIKHDLQRRKNDVGEKFETLISYPTGMSVRMPDTMYTDTTALYNVEYQYRVVATDDSNLSSKSRIAKATCNKTVYRDPPANMEGCFIGKSIFTRQNLTAFNNTVSAVDFMLSRKCNVLTWTHILFNNKKFMGADGAILKDFVIFRSDAIANPPVMLSTIDARDAAQLVTQIAALGGNAICMFQSTRSGSGGIGGQNGGTSITTGPPVTKDFCFIDSDLVSPSNTDKKLYYWIMAEFEDGSTSEITGPIPVYVEIK